MRTHALSYTTLATARTVSPDKRVHLQVFVSYDYSSGGQEYTLTEWQKRVFRPISKEPFRHELVWLVPIPRYKTSSQNQSSSYEAIQRTIVVQAVDVNNDLRP